MSVLINEIIPSVFCTYFVWLAVYYLYARNSQVSIVDINAQKLYYRYSNNVDYYVISSLISEDLNWIINGCINHTIRISFRRIRFEIVFRIPIVYASHNGINVCQSTKNRLYLNFTKFKLKVYFRSYKICAKVHFNGPKAIILEAVYY